MSFRSTSQSSRRSVSPASQGPSRPSSAGSQRSSLSGSQGPQHTPSRNSSYSRANSATRPPLGPRTPSLPRVNEGVRLTNFTSPPHIMPRVFSPINNATRPIYKSHWETIKAQVAKDSRMVALAMCNGDEAKTKVLEEDYNDSFIFLCDKIFNELQEQEYYQHMQEDMKCCAYEELVWYHVGSDEGIAFMGDTHELNKFKHFYFANLSERTELLAQAALAKPRGPQLKMDVVYEERYQNHGDAEEDEGGVPLFWEDEVEVKVEVEVETKVEAEKE